MIFIKYVITNGHGSYIKYDLMSKKYVPIRNRDFASTWEDRAKAKNILNNCIPGNIRGGYKVKEFQETQRKKDNSEKEKEKEPDADQKKSFPVHEAKKISNKEIYDSNVEEWENGFKEVETFFVNVDVRRRELTEKLSTVDKEISDINHYIEFNSFNAYQGWLVSSMLKNRLQQRREYKDELLVLAKVHRCSLSKKEIFDVKNASVKIKDRHYAPRVLKELF